MIKNISRRVFAAIMIISTVLAQTGAIGTVCFTRANTEAQQAVGLRATDAIPDESEFTPENKVAKSADADDMDSADYVPGEVIVKYKAERINLKKASGRIRAEAMAKNMDLGMKEGLEKSNISVLEIRDGATVEEMIAQLEEDPNVEYAQPNFQYRTAALGDGDARMTDLWGLNNTGQVVDEVTGTADADIDAPEAWTISEGTNTAGAGGVNVDIIVAVIDSGTDYGHIDLSDSMWNGTDCLDHAGNPLGGCLHGYDFTGTGDKDPLPTTVNHGTHVAGTIAAVKDNGTGIVGVAPHAKIMALKTDLKSTELIRSVNFAKFNGAKIINASWGGYGDTENDSALREAIAGFPGLFVAAAGNGETNHDTGNADDKFYPSDWDLANIISVAATDQNDALAYFSDYGASSVDVGAPGVNILSSVSVINMLYETFEGTAASGVPSGWSKTGTANNWGVENIGGDYGMVMSGDLASPYADGADTALTTPAYDLRNSTSATLILDSGCDTEYTDYGPDVQNDYLALEFSNDNGATFSEIERWNEPNLDWYFGLPEDPAGSVAMTLTESIPAEYLTQYFKMRFRWVTDSSQSEAGGCFVDYVEIEKMPSSTRDSYEYYNGTSMATPHVAGSAALIWGYKPNLSAAQVKSIIMDTGDSKGALSGNTVTGKRINAANALIWLTPTASVTYSVTSMTDTDVVATLHPDEESMTITSAGGLTHTFTANGSFTFTFTDTDGNTGSTVATVDNIDKIAPVIALNGNDAINVLIDGTYTEPGATVTDNHDTELTATASGAVDVNTIGSYTITYTATDAAGNAAAAVTRTVNIVDALDSAENDITSFRLAGMAATIDEANHTMTVTVPFGTDVTSLTPVVMVSAGASVSPISGASNDFTSVQDYTVTAENSVATQAYTVTVTVAPDPDIALLSADKDALTAGSLIGTDPDAAHITAALINPLPATGSVNGSAIVWTSNSPDVISNDGQTVNRPIYSAGDSNVTMTATLTKGAITNTKDFALTVTRLAASTIATVTSSAYAVGADTISGVSYGTSKSVFLAAVSKGESHQTWSEAELSAVITSGNTLAVTAEDGVTSVTYAISVNSAPSGGGGGGSITPVTVSASDEPLQLKSTQQGTLNRILDEKNKVKLEIPKGSIDSTTTFSIEKAALSDNDAPEDMTGAFLFSGLAFDIEAEDNDGREVDTFAKDLTVTLTLSDLPADTSTLKIYYYDETDKKWVLIGGVTFTANTASFTVDHLTKFAVFDSKTAITGETVDTTGTDATGSMSVSDGDIIQCKTSANPFAVYIVKSVNGKNYLRHIINLNIFSHYKHLRWENLKQVASLSAYGMSGWVRANTGANGTAGRGDKVWEINGDQTRHWINMTAEQFLLHGGSDEAIYIINQGELDLYTIGADVMSL